MATVSNQTVSPQKLQGDDKDNSNIFQLIRSQQKNLLRYVLLRRFVRLLTVFASIATPQSQTTTTNSTCFSFFGLWASQPVTVLVSLATVAVALTQEDASKKRREVTFNLFVGNLSYDATDKDLKEFFNNEGHSVVSTEVIFHETIQNSLVYGYVSFKSKKESEAALISVQGKAFMGRSIRIEHSNYFIRNKQPATESVESELTSPELKSGVKEA
ncbi:hypothetical protein F8388_006440 [Cannabis sativa]|uniref:RRM domain-containing protein n=1 Tax=Cannabis sativa TaxID=3483 RepID=A0A7J6F8W2_CANSA|nr:hypothetical protein F8388_006440 [Cannabis sativa]